MLMLGNLVVFALVIGLVLLVVHPQRVSSLDQVIAQVAVATFSQAAFFGIKISRLVAGPGKACILSQGSLVFKAFDVADFGNDTGG